MEDRVENINTVEGIASIAIVIGDTTLFCKTVESKYIITYIDEYDTDIDDDIERIFDAIFRLYDSNKLAYANVCGANAEYICKNVKIPGIKLGKIIITNWINTIEENINTIESIYGPIDITIGASYHALAYLEITKNGKKYYVAIETTSCNPYKLQFYIDADENNFTNIIKTRYQCIDFICSFECDKIWWEIARVGGKKSKKQKSRNKKPCKRRKTRNRRKKC